MIIVVAPLLIAGAIATFLWVFNQANTCPSCGHIMQICGALGCTPPVQEVPAYGEPRFRREC